MSNIDIDTSEFDAIFRRTMGADSAEILADSPPPVEDSGGKGPSQASKLVKLARERYDLFMSEDGRPYAVQLDGPNTALPLRGKAGLRSQLALLYADENGGSSAPSQAALADAMTVLEGLAASVEPRKVEIRVAPHEGGTVIDLGTPDGRCVIVRPDGWELATRSPILFRRSGAMKPMSEPVRDGDGLAKLQGLLNTNEESFRLLVGWLVASFIADLPHPILAFRGEQGTGKSKAAQAIIGIIDPSGAPKRTAPRDIKSWATQAFNSWALCLDNVSTVPDWLSDALCRAVTGDGIVDRALYSDDDVVVLEFQRVLAMTTIDAGALAGDLAERLLTIELNLIPSSQRREESDLDGAYMAAHGAILASLFDLLAKVLKARPDARLTERPRMADFARVLAAVDAVTGWTTLESYKNTARDAVSDVLDGEPFAQAVTALVDRSGPKGIRMTAGELLGAIDTPEKLPKKWPKDATRCGGQLKRLAPALRTIGIEIDDTDRGKGRNRTRYLVITASKERRCETASTASAASATGDNRPLTSTNTADTARTLVSAVSPSADTADASADTGARLVSAVDNAPDLRVYLPSDAADTADTEMRQLSNMLTLCTVCAHSVPPSEWGDCAKSCGKQAHRYGSNAHGTLCEDCFKK